MISRRQFLALLPLTAFLRFPRPAKREGGGSRAVEPDDTAWDWWRKLPRTLLTRSEDPLTDALCRAAAARGSVAILYDGGSEPGGQRVISPLGVFQVEGFPGVYVHALCHKRGGGRTFRVDRIRALV